jgi:hypothetical protein
MKGEIAELLQCEVTQAIGVPQGGFPLQTATLIAVVPSGLTRNETDELVQVCPFLGKTGAILEREDTGYDTERPTGYEPVYYLVDFGEQKLWLPFALYWGDDKNGKEIWEKYLRIV